MIKNLFNKIEKRFKDLKTAYKKMDAMKKKLIIPLRLVKSLIFDLSLLIKL